jgi:hypothetical protein
MVSPLSNQNIPADTITKFHDRNNGPQKARPSKHKDSTAQHGHVAIKKTIHQASLSVSVSLIEEEMNNNYDEFTVSDLKTYKGRSKVDTKNEEKTIWERGKFFMRSGDIGHRKHGSQHQTLKSHLDRCTAPRGESPDIPLPINPNRFDFCPMMAQGSQHEILNGDNPQPNNQWKHMSPKIKKKIKAMQMPHSKGGNLFLTQFHGKKKYVFMETSDFSKEKTREEQLVSGVLTSKKSAKQGRDKSLDEDEKFAP